MAGHHADSVAGVVDMLVATEDGCEIAVHDLGGNGPVLLLVHAASFTASMFTPLARLLAPRFHCLAPDLPGHGASDRPKDGDYSWTRLSDALGAVVDAIDAPILGFGHSFGGTLLLAATARHPQTVRALVCFEPVVVDSAVGRAFADAQAARSERRRDHFESELELLDRLSGKPPLDRLDSAALHAYVKDGFEERPDGSLHLVLSREDEARIYREGANVDFDAELRELTQPVTILIGQDSPVAEALGAAHLAAILSRVQVSIVKAATHFAPFEDPAALALQIGHAFDTSIA